MPLINRMWPGINENFPAWLFTFFFFFFPNLRINRNGERQCML